jgi:small-conductance mechanosensitive channel
MGEEWLRYEFWREILHRTVSWAIGALPALLLVALAGYVALRVTAFLVKRLDAVLRKRSGKRSRELERRVATLLSISGTALRAVIWSMIVLLGLVQLGVDVAPLIAGAGIVGLAIGFGAQELVRDVISGFFMLLEDDIRRGDWAIINGTPGYVESVTLRTVVLRDEGGVVHVFQNGKIATLSNTTKDWSAVLLDVAIAYEEDVERALAAIERTAEALRDDDALGARLLEPLEVLGVEAFDDSKTTVRVRLKTEPLAQFEIGRAFRRRLVRAFHEARIRMPETSQLVRIDYRAPQKQQSRARSVPS